jgi:hypothetical protein
VRINRYDGPEDGSLADRCLTRGLPDFVNPFGGSFRRIVQTPGGVSIYYDVGQGQGWQRNIVMDASPHLPASIRQWYGDSRQLGGDTLVIDVTNFSQADFLGARESLHLVDVGREAASTLNTGTIDPTVWTRSWTVKQQFTKQATGRTSLLRAALHRRNYGYRGYHGQRMEEFAFAEDEVLIRNQRCLAPLRYRRRCFSSSGPIVSVARAQSDRVGQLTEIELVAGCDYTANSFANDSSGQSHVQRSCVSFRGADIACNSAMRRHRGRPVSAWAVHG